MCWREEYIAELTKIAEDLADFIDAIGFRKAFGIFDNEFFTMMVHVHLKLLHIFFDTTKNNLEVMDYIHEISKMGAHVVFEPDESFEKLNELAEFIQNLCIYALVVVGYFDEDEDIKEAFAFADKVINAFSHGRRLP